MSQIQDFGLFYAVIHLNILPKLTIILMTKAAQNQHADSEISVPAIVTFKSCHRLQLGNKQTVLS